MLNEEYFSLTREDDCIWLRDTREDSAVEIHLDPEQAHDLGLALLEIVDAR